MQEGNSDLACPAPQEWCKGGGNVGVPTQSGIAPPSGPTGGITPPSGPTGYPDPDLDNWWDYAPDFSHDTIPPYPSLKDDNGKNITIDSIRGTHLFGWKGCDEGDRDKVIKSAYNSFFTLADQLSVSNNIKWDSDAAIDFFGPADGKYKIPDGTRTEIARKSEGLHPFKAGQH